MLRRTLAMRDAYLDPLNVLQVGMLHRSRSGLSNEKLRRGLLLTINGSAEGDAQHRLPGPDDSQEPYCRS